MPDLSLDAFPKNSTGHELADLVFVHGIGGHPLKTWQPKNFNQSGFWPEWVAADLPIYRVWSVGYPAAKTMWDKRGSFSLPKRATSLLVNLDAKHLGERPIVFITHSLGGLVVKQLLRVAQDSSEPRLQRFVKNTLGIIFIATPHLGADIATVADRLRIVARPSDALADLKKSGPYLDDLKHWFSAQATKHGWRILAFREGRSVKYGFKAVEDGSADPGISGVRPIDIDADHISICQPETRTSAIYEDTKAFLEELGKKLEPARIETRAVGGDVQIVYEQKPDYPFVDLSICNRGSAKIAVTELRVVKGASIKDEHGSERCLTGPKMKLEFSLRGSHNGRWRRTLRDSVCKLESSECDTFQLQLTSENTLNLVDIDVEFISANSAIAQRYLPIELLIIHSPVSTFNSETEVDSGTISIVKRSDALRALLNRVKLNLWQNRSYAECSNLYPLLMRGAAFVARENLLINWEMLRSIFEGKWEWGPILASFSDFAVENEVPSSIIEYMRMAMRNPTTISGLGFWDTECFSATILSNLMKLRRNSQGNPELTDSAEYLEILDKTLFLPDTENIYSVALACYREIAHRAFTKIHGRGSVEFMIMSLQVQPHDAIAYHELLYDIVNEGTILTRGFQKKIPDLPEVQFNEGKILAFWLNWWEEREGQSLYKSVGWRRHSPRLTSALQAYQTRERTEIETFLCHEDALVRWAAARNRNIAVRHREILTRDSSAIVRLTLARDEHTDLDALAVLSDDESSAVRRWVANHPKLNRRLAEKFVEDESMEVRAFLARNSSCPRDLIERLAQSDVEDVAQSARRQLEVPGK